MGFWSGFALFIAAAFEVMGSPALREWYFRVVKRCFLLALLILAVLVFGGVWAFKALGHGWWSDVGALLWVICGLVLSGKLTLTLMGSLMGPLADEKALLSALVRTKVVGLKPASSLDRRREIIAAFRGVLISLVAWPLFLFPPLIPLGIFLFAWSMGRESLATAIRVCHQNGEKTRDEMRAPFALGLGLVPAATALIPVVGWAFWPLLLVSSVRAVRMP